MFDRVPILVTYRFDPESVRSFPRGIAYRPWVGAAPGAAVQAQEFEGLPTAEVGQILLAEHLVTLRPRVLVVGSNEVTSTTLRRWRAAVPLARLLIVRRGTELGRIDLDTARALGIDVVATPHINSPYVAQHIDRQLDVDRASRLAVIGVGHIGSEVARSAVAVGASVRVYSPTLSNPRTRVERLESLGLTGLVQCASSVAEAVADATHVAIAVPWLRADGMRNAGIVGAVDVESMASPVRLVSVSHPQLLEAEAWDKLDRRAATGEASVRVDTGVALARDLARRCRNINVAHDVAFADRRCQQALDREVLTIAERFLEDGDGFGTEARWL